MWTVFVCWFTGFVVMGAIRICDIRNDPSPVLTTGEEITIEILASAIWPATLAYKIHNATNGNKKGEFRR